MLLDKSLSCPSLLTVLPSNDGQNLGVSFDDDYPLPSNDGCQIQGVPPDDDSPLLSSDGRLNCLSPSAMVFAMSNDFLTQPSSALAMSPVQPEGTFGNIQGQDATPSSHFLPGGQFSGLQSNPGWQLSQIDPRGHV